MRSDSMASRRISPLSVLWHAVELVGLAWVVYWLLADRGADIPGALLIFGFAIWALGSLLYIAFIR